MFVTIFDLLKATDMHVGNACVERMHLLMFPKDGDRDGNTLMEWIHEHGCKAGTANPMDFNYRKRE